MNSKQDKKENDLIAEAYSQVKESDGEYRYLDPGMKGHDEFYGPETVDAEWHEDDVQEAIDLAALKYEKEHKSLADLSENEWVHHAIDALFELRSDVVNELQIDVRESEEDDFDSLYQSKIKNLFNQYAHEGGWSEWS